MNQKLLAFHFDLKRPMWRRDYMDRMVTRLKAWGYNAILYEIEDKLRFASHPQIAHPQAWSPQETSDFVANCRSQGIEVIPMMQSLGHAESVVGKPQYAHLREQASVVDQYDPLSLEARDLILELFDEIIEVFKPQRYFHIGGDETASLGKSEKCRAVVEQIGVGGLYLRHMRPIIEHILARGLRPMLWADIVLQHPEVIPQIPREVVLVDWNYTRCSHRSEQINVWGKGLINFDAIKALPESPVKQLVFRHAVDEQTHRDKTMITFYHTDLLVKQGFDVIAASAVRCANDTVAIPATKHLENTWFSARKGMTSGLGEIVTSWAVRYNHPELNMPAAFGAAMALETNEALDRKKVMTQYTLRTFGIALPELDHAWNMLSLKVPFAETFLLWAGAKMLAKSEDPLAEFMEGLRTQNLEVPYLRIFDAVPTNCPMAPGQPEAWIIAAQNQVHTRREGFLQGRVILKNLKQRARQNADIFDFWLEGAEAAIFYADFARALLHDELERESTVLLGRIDQLREQTRELWEQTYDARAIEDELIVRFGFHEACLLGSGAHKLEPLTTNV